MGGPLALASGRIREKPARLWSAEKEGGVAQSAGRVLSGGGAWTADASMKLIRAPFARWRFASATEFIVFAPKLSSGQSGAEHADNVSASRLLYSGVSDVT